MNSIDLNQPPPGHKFDVSIEKEESVAERRVRLFKDVALFVAALGLVALVAIYCFRALLDPTSTADEKKWAMSVLAAATGGLRGYLVRK